MKSCKKKYIRNLDFILRNGIRKGERTKLGMLKMNALCNFMVQRWKIMEFVILLIEVVCYNSAGIFKLRTVATWY